jgi:hypothetical protein
MLFIFRMMHSLSVKCIRSHTLFGLFTVKKIGSQDSSVSIGTRIRTEQLSSQGLISGSGKRFSLLHSVQTGSGPHSASCMIGTGACFPVGKVAGPRS